MKSTRPLDNDEIRRVSACFTGMFEIRNRGLFMLGVSTGGRISELPSLEIGDVYQNGKPVTESDRNHLLYNSIKNTDDQTLITELERRGYNLDRQREGENTAEIVKIG